MELYKKYPVTETNINGFAHKKATVDDVRTWAKEKGLAVVPMEPNRAMRHAGCEEMHTVGNMCSYISIYKAMIKAAEEVHDK